MSYINNGGGGGSGLVVVSPPASDTSPGSPYQIAFDSSGNLYFCYAPNTWSKYLNTAPFGGAPGAFRIDTAGNQRVDTSGNSRIITGAAIQNVRVDTGGNFRVDTATNSRVTAS